MTTSKILTGAVDTVSIGDGAVSTIKIEDNAITPRKIADSAVGSCQIEDNAIIGTKLPDDVIDNNKINNSCDFTVNGLDITSPNLGINSVDYKFPSSVTDGRFLKHNSGGNLEWVLPSSFEPQAGAVVLNKVLPVGSILPYTSTTLPTDGNFLPCDGTERLVADFPELAGLLGSTYGTPSTSGKFKLPNLDGKVPIGNGTGNDGTDSCAFTIGSTGGEYNHQLSIGEMPIHNHDLSQRCIYSHHDQPPIKPANYLVASCCGGAKSNISMSNYGAVHAGYILSAGNDEPHNNIQPYTVTKYIIKAIPDEVIQYNPTLSNGLSALDGTGAQTNTIDLSTTEIGLKVASDLGYDGAGNLDIVNVDFAKLNLPPNFPIQTVQSVKTDVQQIYGPDLGVNGFEEITGLRTSISKHSRFGKVRVQGIIVTSNNWTTTGVAVKVMKIGRYGALEYLGGGLASNTNGIGAEAGSRLRVTGQANVTGAYSNSTIPFDIIDVDPNPRGSTVEYVVLARLWSGATGYINRSSYDTNINDYVYRTVSTLTLTELTPDV